MLFRSHQWCATGKTGRTAIASSRSTNGVDQRTCGTGWASLDFEVEAKDVEPLSFTPRAPAPSVDTSVVAGVAPRMIGSGLDRPDVSSPRAGAPTLAAKWVAKSSCTNH